MYEELLQGHRRHRKPMEAFEANKLSIIKNNRTTVGKLSIIKNNRTTVGKLSIINNRTTVGRS
jgi:hypothetical protein